MISEMLFPGPKINEAAIQELEMRLGEQLPSEYRSFLLQHNGGRPVPEDTFAVSGRSHNDMDSVGGFFGINPSDINTDIYSAMDNLKGRIPPHTMPIAYGACGGTLLLRLGGPHRGQVLLWDQDEEQDNSASSENNIYLIARSFEEFLGKLRPFDY